MAPWNFGINLFKQDHDNNDSNEKAKDPRSESLELVWTTAFDPKKAEDQIFEFELGKAISFPSKWKFILRPIHLKPSTFVAVFVCLDEVDNKKYDDVVNRAAQTCLQIPVSWSIQLLSPLESQESIQVNIDAAKLDFGQGPCFGVRRLVDVENLHRFIFPNENEKLKLKLKFTLFKPIKKTLTKEELREQALKNCDVNIYSQLRNPELSNVIIVTSDGHKLHVHRIALLRSPYFAKLLLKTGSGNESTGKLVMNVDKPMKMMQIIMCHIHFGQLSDELLDPAEYTITFIRELAEAAAEYGLLDLETYLVDYYPGFKEELTNDAECAAMNKKVKYTEQAKEPSV